MHIFLAGEAQSGGNFSMWGLTALLIVAVYFMMIRPQQKRRKAQQAMQDSLGLGSEVVTIGGLYGTVTELGDEAVTLEVAPGVTNRYVRGAISRVVTPVAQSEETDSEESSESTEK